jgi:DNA-binding GntR family transcriptional regulator
MVDRACDVLRAAIVAGDFQPGDRLKEVELAQQLGVSRAPVREALRQLEHEGLVASLPYRATQVLGISQEEIEQVLVPIRMIIESVAFRNALPHLSEEDFAALSGLVAVMRRAGVTGDLDGLASADVRFHELVIERSGQPHCLQLWRTIEPRVRAYFRRDASLHSQIDANEVADEHEELLDVLRRGDEAQLLTTLERHIHDYFGPPGMEAAG